MTGFRHRSSAYADLELAKNLEKEVEIEPK